MLGRRRFVRALAGIAVVAFIAGVLAGADRAFGLAAFGKQFRTDYPHSGFHVNGTILNGGGSAGGGATILVNVRTWYGGGGFTYGTRANRHGHYSVWVPPGPSRLITIVAGGTSIREIRELVHPHVWLNATSRGHGTMLFRGGISVDHHGTLPTVLLQDATPHGWQTFGAVLPSSRSHLYRYVYHNAPAGAMGHRFAFRAVTLQNNAWMPGYSAPRSAVIR